MKDETDETPRARVFVSCGQRNEEEKQLGLNCLSHLQDRGFECHFAEAVHNLEGLTENIFRHLRNAEYAVFIDCCRDELEPDCFRGSVFVNQELAIAAFLEIDSRVFHQEGVKREGVVEYLIANPVPFKDRKEFLAKLEEATKRWRSGWRNELVLEVSTPHPNVEINDATGSPLSDWYHLRVTNRHGKKYARNCVAYVVSVKNLNTGEEFDPGNFELIWAGTGFHERHILPKRNAEIDAFFILHAENFIRFHHRPSTSGLYSIPHLYEGKYELAYLIVSENFEPVQKTFRLKFGGDFKSIEFRGVSVAP